MPIPKIYEEVIEMLTEATEQGLVTWKKGENGVAVSVGESNFELWAGSDEHTERGFVAFVMREKGKNLDNWYVDEGEDDYSEMRELFQNAQRQVHGIAEKLQALKTMLINKQRIGD